MSEKQTILCPSCGTSIDVNDILYHQLQDQARKEYNEKISQHEKEYANKVTALQEEYRRLETDKQHLQEQIKLGIESGVKDQKNALEKQIRNEQEDQFKFLQEELRKKSEEVKELNKARAQIAVMQRNLDEQRDRIMAEAENKFTNQLQEAREQIKKQEADQHLMKLKEKDLLIEKLNENLKEAQRRAEQGSTQAQGEAMELAIEDYLRAMFPMDTIEEVKKGARGADCIQVIHTRTHQHCGTIYYESKRTKNFQPAWIEKFRDDMREKNATMGVIVTEVLPAGMDRMGQIDGIWVCTFEEFKGMCFLLRETVVQINTALVSQENKGDKMSMLYEYLTGNEFRLQLEGIMSSYMLMREDLEREKRSIQGHWKKREKQLLKILRNTSNVYNSVRGIAGTAVQEISSLELDEPDETIDIMNEEEIDMFDEPNLS